MSKFTETTAENLRAIREENSMNQDEVAVLLGVEKYSISRLENGNRALSSAEKAILDWHFFGIMPPRLANQTELRGVLEFSEEEWAVIGVLAGRVGQTHKQWIRSAVLNIVYGSALPLAIPKNGTQS